MAIKRRKFQLGVRLKPTTQPTVDNGDISVSSVDNKIKTTTYTYAEFDILTSYSVGDKVKYSTENKNYVCIQAGTGNLPTNAAFWEVYEQSIVTEDQDQTLTNKTIDADNNTISNIETDNLKAGVLVTDISTATSDTELPSALAVKTALEGQNDAVEINYTSLDDQAISDFTEEVGVDNVKDALDILDEYSFSLRQDLDSIDESFNNHTDQFATGAHKASNISNAPSGNLAATDVQGALDELQTDIDDLVTLSGVAANSEDLGTFTGNIISDNTTVKGALQELETQSTTNASTLGSHIANTTSAHGVMGAVVGTLNFQTIKFKQYEGASFRKMQKEAAEDNTQSGTDVVLTEPTDPIVRLLGDVTPLESIAGIAQASYAAYQVVTLVNVTANDIEIKNNTGTTAEERILTGTDDDITLAPDAALFLKYDATSSRWRVIGGTGGASTAVKGTAGENLTALQFAALDLDGNIYKLDASNDDRIESVGIVKADALSTESVKTITSGIIKGFTGLTVGAPLYADPLNAGGYTQTEPSDSSFNNKWVIRLGIAISATQVLLNPDQGASAYFKDELSSKPSITNNQSVSANVQDLIFDGTQVRGAVVKYTIYRTTDTQEVAQIGDFKVIYKSIEGSWSLGADNYHGDNAGVNFTITNSGQVQYTSTDLTGANYSGVLDYSVTELFKI